MDWILIGSLEDIPRLGARTVETSLGQVAVFRTSDDAVFALVNRCPHRGGPLSEGIVMGRKVACPLHNWVIDLNTGAADAPDEGCTDTLPVRLEGSQVWLNPSPLAGEGGGAAAGRGGNPAASAKPPHPPIAMAMGPSLPREGGGA